MARWRRKHVHGHDVRAVYSLGDDLLVLLPLGVSECFLGELSYYCQMLMPISLLARHARVDLCACLDSRETLRAHYESHAAGPCLYHHAGTRRL
jgi:hypothetical protein